MFEGQIQLVLVGFIDISALVFISIIKKVHQFPETESHFVVEPRLVRRWFKRGKAFAQTIRGEQSSPSFLNLKGCSSNVERAQELSASLLHIPSKISHVALLSLAQSCKPFFLQTGPLAELEIVDFVEEQKTVGEEGVVALPQNEAVELVVGHVIVFTRFQGGKHVRYQFHM